MEFGYNIYVFTIGFYNVQVGMLLEHTVGNLDPLYIVAMVPDGLKVPRLVFVVVLFIQN